MQYTKRILPAFIIPECNILLENTIIMLKEFPDSNINLDRASQILGTVCDETIKKHYKRIKEITDNTNLELLTHLSHLSSFAILTKDLPDENGLVLLIKYIQLYENTITRMGEPGDGFTINIFLFRTYYLKQARKKIFIPMDFISKYHFFFDTS